MKEEQIKVLRKSWSQVTPLGDAAAELFYDRLFKIDPGAQSLFGGTNFSQQYRNLLQAINYVVQNVDKVDVLMPVLSGLGQRHATYGVRDEHYDSVGEALIWTLEQGLGDQWSAEVRDVWCDAYNTVSTVMKHAANDAMQQSRLSIESPLQTVEIACWDQYYLR